MHILFNSITISFYFQFNHQTNKFGRSQGKVQQKGSNCLIIIIMMTMIMITEIIQLNNLTQLKCV